MGQTTSQNTNNKNIRNEFLKSNNPNQHHFSTAGPGGTGPNGASTNPLSYGNYASEELNEEDETVCPTINSKSSYVRTLKYYNSFFNKLLFMNTQFN